MRNCMSIKTKRSAKKKSLFCVNIFNRLSRYFRTFRFNNSAGPGQTDGTGRPQVLNVRSHDTVETESRAVPPRGTSTSTTRGLHLRAPALHWTSLRIPVTSWLAFFTVSPSSSMHMPALCTKKGGGRAWVLPSKSLPTHRYSWSLCHLF
jgi:hypothetical protein